MKLEGKVVVVTGGASGIGKALVERFHREGAAHIVVADLNLPAAETVAASIGGTAVRCDCTREEDIQRLVEETEAKAGPIDLFCSNAGIADIDPDPENAASSPDAIWERAWKIHTMAHVWAARAVLPSMIARKTGYFLNTISAAGLLNQIGSAVYGTTKHAAVGFAENLAITHRDHGIRVSILCPQGVRTPLLEGLPEGGQNMDGVLTPDQVAQAAVDGIDQETFVILPHETVAAYMRNKAENYDRWIGGMAKLRRSLRAEQNA
jgi:NAD(P)-dependent dehydrogenase (short-subunit alcohol dehydrogenase family)